MIQHLFKWGFYKIQFLLAGCFQTCQTWLHSAGHEKSLIYWWPNFWVQLKKKNAFFIISKNHIFAAGISPSPLLKIAPFLCRALRSRFTNVETVLSKKLIVDFLIKYFARRKYANHSSGFKQIIKMDKFDIKLKSVRD